MKKNSPAVLASIFVLASAVAAPASAVPVSFNVALPFISTFDNALRAEDPTATVHTIQVVHGQNVFSYIDDDGYAQTVTVTMANGGPLDARPGYDSVGDRPDLSGAVYYSHADWSAGGPIPGFNTGITFTFSSPVNAFGAELGHWATTGNETGLPDRPLEIQEKYGIPGHGNAIWFMYDDTPFWAANALYWNDHPGVQYNGGNENFIGAYDREKNVTSITIWSDAIADSFAVGGTLRFATVPEPGSLVLFALALGGMGLARGRKLPVRGVEHSGSQ